MNPDRVYIECQFSQSQDERGELPNRVERVNTADLVLLDCCLPDGDEQDEDSEWEDGDEPPDLPLVKPSRPTSSCFVGSVFKAAKVDAGAEVSKAA